MFKQVYLVAYVQDKPVYALWTSNNGGDSFTSVTLPFRVDGPLVFHPNPSYLDYILAHDRKTMVRNHMLAYSLHSWSNFSQVVFASSFVGFQLDRIPC